ncbi:VWA domain-containing protein [Aeoliella sp. SH292]|uniref:VWA domain-containing protein n=1 Tax=Aeoliella sp. SH292 TaxID=3454464 RepID=UPI003F94ABB1
MVAEIAALAVLAFALLAEWLHVRRSRQIAMLAFGPTARPSALAWMAPLLIALSSAAVVWGLVTLLLLPPKVHTTGQIAEGEMKHLVLVLDVSPSMLLVDAGPDGKQSRRQRVHSLMTSFFERVQLPNYRTSIVAVYNGAKPVVINTKDREVVNNVLDDLPLHFAFTPGKTDLFAGLSEAAEIVRPNPPKSTTLLLLSDGDSVPATGMPEMPPSVEHLIVVGVGDLVVGKFLDGKQSRQDAATLRQIAIRLGGVYHDGNKNHLGTDLIRTIAAAETQGVLDQLSRREFALVACGVGASLLALLPVLLHYFGTSWRPGLRKTTAQVARTTPALSRNTDRRTPARSL